MMSTKYRWLALVVALSLVVGALAPATALAARGGRPIDNPGEPIDPPLEYGDPDPGGSGSPNYVGDFYAAMRNLLLDSLRIRFGVSIVGPLTLTPTSEDIPRQKKCGASR